MPRLGARLLVLAALVASVGAGCFSARDAPEEGTPARDPPSSGEPLGNATFRPPFELVAPAIRAALDDGRAAGLVETTTNVTFLAEFPEGVDASKVATFVWSFGDGVESVGPRQRHRFAAPGVYEVSVTVEDVYGRTARATLPLGVAENRTEPGVVAVGNGARDQVAYAAGSQAWDHRDFPLSLGEGASSARLVLKFEKRPSVSGTLVPAEANNLILKVLDASGRPVAAATGAANPKVLELASDALAPGDLTLRVSGDSGLNVAFALAILVEYGGSDA